MDNLAVLLDTDGASLFLVEGHKGGRQKLVSKVFDVHSGASTFLLPGGKSNGSDNEVQVPWGVGVLGHVAETGEPVNLQVACEVSLCFSPSLLPSPPLSISNPLPRFFFLFLHPPHFNSPFTTTAERNDIIYLTFGI